MPPTIRTPEYALLRAVLDLKVTHRSKANSIALDKAIAESYIYCTAYGNLSITMEGRERLGELEGDG